MCRNRYICILPCVDMRTLRHQESLAPVQNGAEVSRDNSTPVFLLVPNCPDTSAPVPKYLETLRHYPTCAASETCHTRTAGARLASPAELHHVAAAAAGTNSVACGIQMVMPAFNIVVSADRLAKYRPRLIPSIPISASVAYCQVEQ